MILFIIAVAAVATQAEQPETIFQAEQAIEMRLSAGGWRKCTITDPGGSNRVARADCEEFATPLYIYPAGVEIFNTQGTGDVRLPGSCTTTSPYLSQRKIVGCTPAAPTPPPRPQGAAPPPAGS